MQTVKSNDIILMQWNDIPYDKLSSISPITLSYLTEVTSKQDVSLQTEEHWELDAIFVLYFVR